MSIRHWPITERPREKLLNQGPQALSDAELIAIFLRTGVSGQNAIDLARQLLQDFGGLRGLLEADYERIAHTRGIGQAKYVLFQAALEIGRRYLYANLQRLDIMSHAQDACQYLQAKLASYQREVFACLYLDNRHRIIQFDELFHGSIASATVYPREVIKRALVHNAAAVIFAHNHPSGVAEPSQDDIELTKRLMNALEPLEIRVLDHIVVGSNEAVSMAARGLL
ncbi:MAG: DNA repair protein RadC [Coxiellaceae bacterium]|nr:MAG: DNA repair protein RadC [Coxiellaceae bacterium]